VEWFGSSRAKHERLSVTPGTELVRDQLAPKCGDVRKMWDREAALAEAARFLGGQLNHRRRLAEEVGGQLAEALQAALDRREGRIGRVPEMESAWPNRCRGAVPGWPTAPPGVVTPASAATFASDLRSFAPHSGRTPSMSCRRSLSCARSAMASASEQRERGNVLMTKDLNPLQPKVLEFKFYARDVGPVTRGLGVGRERPRRSW
jgi:hypothetical protein